jgi:hypothetical protein
VPPEGRIDAEPISMSRELHVPLDHRVRRRILRRLHRDHTAHTVGGLSVELNLALIEVWYHTRVLARWGKIKELPSGADHANVPVESLVADDPEVAALLISTEVADEPL